jgi:hypothetical protein
MYKTYRQKIYFGDNIFMEINPISITSQVPIQNHDTTNIALFENHNDRHTLSCCSIKSTNNRYTH